MECGYGRTQRSQHRLLKITNNQNLARAETKTAPQASLLVPQRNQRIGLHCPARWDVAGKPAPVPDPFAGRQSVEAGQAAEIAARQRPVKPLNELG